jgi:hypothetical protein
MTKVTLMLLCIWMLANVFCSLGRDVVYGEVIKLLELDFCFAGFGLRGQALVVCRWMNIHEYNCGIEISY